MDRKFYLQFLDTCARDKESLDTLSELIVKQLETPVEVVVRAKEGSDLPIITAHLQRENRLVRPQGGMATIPAAFKSDDNRHQEIKLVPVFVHSDAEIETRYLDYESRHIAALLDRQGEYKNYHQFFFKAPNEKSPYRKKLQYLEHISRRILIHDQEAFFILHPGKNEATVRSLILYQLGERLAWYMEKLAVDKEKTTNDICRMLDRFATDNPFYRNCELSSFFRQTLVTMSVFS
jgi:hypothetical protein